MTNLAFLDLETTGLNPLSDRILEVGVVIWNPSNREVVAEDNWVGRLEDGSLDGIWDQIPEDVQKMHTDNNLWNEVKNSHWDITEHSDDIRDFLAQYDAVGGPMCGNSIHFDREFLRFNQQDALPGVLEMFNHRNIDVSTFDNTARYFPDVLKPTPRGNAHRAIEDCHMSIRNYTNYLEQISNGSLNRD